MKTSLNLLKIIVMNLIFLIFISGFVLSQAITPDDYEEDDTFTQATLIIAGGESQHHNFHKADDEDWVIFYAISGYHTIKAYNIEDDCDVMIELYDTDGKTSLKEEDDNSAGKDEEFNYSFSKEGFYYLRVKSDSFGEHTGYDLQISFPYGDVGGITGYVTDKISGKRLANVDIEAIGIDKKIPYPTKSNDTINGNEETIGSYYINSIEYDSYKLTAKLDGYCQFSDEVDVKSYETISKPIVMTPGIYIDDAILNLQVLIGKAGTGKDVTNDEKIGLDDVICILQVISGLR